MTGYVADEVGYAIIEIDVDALPPSRLRVPAMGRALRLRVWNEVNRGDVASSRRTCRGSR